MDSPCQESGSGEEKSGLRQSESGTRRRSNGNGKKTLASLAVLAGLLLVIAIHINNHFDTYFPIKSRVRIIAHRGGGVEGPENTVAGIEAACAAGAYGTEIDIQRTKDGHYILLHDGDFKRVAGDKRTPEELTLEEAKKISIDGQPVPTFEEALAASRGRLVLFTELKGKSADRRMADDIAQIIIDNHLEEDCVLISLKYDLIDYIEEEYPDIQTGFLLFAGYGNTEMLHCDYLAFEEESATKNVISAVHDQGKEILVWTANKAKSQKFFLCTDADGMITDYVKDAVKIRQELENRTDLQRMTDRIKVFMR